MVSKFMSLSEMVKIPRPFDGAQGMLQAKQDPVKCEPSEHEHRVCSDKGNPVRHARGGGHPGWTAKELDSRFRGNDGRGHFPVGVKPTYFRSLGLRPRVV